jgi:hypothetical protein
MKIGDSVHVGGCVGAITEISETEVVVKGTYTYPGDEKITRVDNWVFTYERKQFEECPKEWVGRPCIDAENLNPLRYYG